MWHCRKGSVINLCPTDVPKLPGQRVSFFVDALIRVNDVGGAPQRLGEFSTREEAFAASRLSIDEFLLREYKPGMPVKTLYGRFREFGAVPVILRDDDDTADFFSFNPIKYALERCEEICRAVVPQT